MSRAAHILEPHPEPGKPRTLICYHCGGRCDAPPTPWGAELVRAFRAWADLHAGCEAVERAEEAPLARTA